MTLVASTPPSPLRVIISGGLAGPPGAGVAGAALDANGHLVLSLSNGPALPPVDLSDAVAQASINASTLTTMSGSPVTTLSGLPVQTGGFNGPAGVGVAGAALDAGGNLVLSLTNGATLPPVDLPAAVVQAAMTASTLTTLSGSPITTLSGVPLQRSN